MVGLRAGAVLMFQSPMFGPGKKKHKEQKNEIRGVEVSEKICCEAGGIFDLVARSIFILTIIEPRRFRKSYNLHSGHELFETHEVGNSMD